MAARKMTHNFFTKFVENGDSTFVRPSETTLLEYRYETSFYHTATDRPNGHVRMYEQRKPKRDTRKGKHGNMRGRTAHAVGLWFGSALRPAVTASLHAAVSSPAKQHVNTSFGRLRNLVAGLFVLSAPAFADTQAISPGATMTAAQAAHAFDAGCVGSVPALLEKQAALFKDAFFFGPADLGTDAGYASADGAISITVDGNPIAAVCEMTIASEIGGDGADLYDGIVNHLVARLGEEPAADYTDGGVIWSWEGTNASFSYSYTEADGSFILTFEAES